MSNPAEKKRFPLHIHIASLFTILVLLIGITLAWVSYKQISDLTFETTEILFGNTVDQLELQFQKEYRPVATSVNLLASASIAEAATLEERMQHMPILAEVIKDEPQISGFGIGYSNGDYFIMRPLNTVHLRTVFEAPDEAIYVIDHIKHNQDGKNQQIRIFLAGQLEPVGEAISSRTDYDPRLRPWYRQPDAISAMHITSPYMFYFSKKIGLTISKSSARGRSTVAVDITLDSLAGILRENRITPSTFSLIFNDKDEILSHSTSDGSPFGDTPQDSIPLLSELPKPLVERIRDLAILEGKVVPFKYKDELWFGTVRDISTKNRLNIKLLTAAPERELLASAFEVRKTSIMIIVGVVLLVLPIAWFTANQIARPLRKLAHEARAIADFNFDNEFKADSIVLEVDQLSNSMDSMRITISNFFKLITSLSAESDINRLLDRVTDETMNASGAEAAVIYLLSDDETELIAQPLRLESGRVLSAAMLPTEALTGEVKGNSLLDSFNNQKVCVEVLAKDQPDDQHLLPLFEAMDASKITAVVLPLTNRNNHSTGLLCLLYGAQSQGLNNTPSPEHIGFAQALSGFAAVSMESRQLLKMQKDLLQSFIELIASAIDAKSPYTGGHCQRVPELTKMLAAAACDSKDPRFADFSLSEEEWEELHIAAWLHDCGKVTTPEYVVDKATKLETIYDRIHEIRMRFEVLKRDAEVEFWQKMAEGEPREHLQQQLDQKLVQLDDDFAFVATCNEGGEFMAPEKLARLNEIASRTWQRTISDRIGISWEEGLRKQRVAESGLPVEEPLIADKQEHIFYRNSDEIIADDNPWKFKLDTPEHKYNKGELYNLSVTRGTLAPEERFKINDHMVQTIIMLNQLPFPKHLRNVPAIAGGHHETMIGTGYPKKLQRDDMSLTARMMAIADIFEALTASDRPYKKAKSLSESVKIMSFMVKDQHIDADLFELFLQSGVYVDYARRFLNDEQIDEVDVAAYLDAGSKTGDESGKK
jgi:HD-GYP domain-containing protein (c-di-GMP phosphodiesterase class II)